MTDENATVTNDEGTTSTESAAPKKVAELPEWAQSELSRARTDAATYRTKLRAAEEQLTTVQGELQAATDKASDLEVKLTETSLTSLKIDAALEIGVPGEQLKAFADRLRGNTPEELRADAEAVKALYGVGVPTRATDPSAGLGNGQPKKTAESAFAEFVQKQLR